jgi:hypothetical protein
MFHNASSTARESRPTAKRLAWSSVLGLAAAVLAAGCEDKALGRSCDLRADASVSATQGAYSMPAADCPSGICAKPAVQPGVSTDLTTGPYCTIRCNADNDCDGQTRDFTNTNDKRCMKGFVCAIPFGEGKLCCQKLCLCRDFFSSSVGPAIPAACQNDAVASCS